MFSIKTFCIFEKKVKAMKEAMLFVEKYRQLFDFDLVECDSEHNRMQFSEWSFLRVNIDEKNLSKDILVEMFEEMKLLKKSNVEIDLIITFK